MSLPAGTYVPTKVTRPRKTGGPGADSPCQGEMARRARGGRDKVTMSARCAKALIGAVPRRRFGYFAAVGKVTSSLPAPQGGTPEAKRSFAQSSFAYFSFKKSKAQSQGNRAAGPTFNPAAWRISFTP